MSRYAGLLAIIIAAATVSSCGAAATEAEIIEAAQGICNDVEGMLGSGVVVKDDPGPYGETWDRLVEDGTSNLAQYERYVLTNHVMDRCGDSLEVLFNSEGIDARAAKETEAAREAEAAGDGVNLAANIVFTGMCGADHAGGTGTAHVVNNNDVPVFIEVELRFADETSEGKKTWFLDDAIPARDSVDLSWAENALMGNEFCEMRLKSARRE